MHLLVGPWTERQTDLRWSCSFLHWWVVQLPLTPAATQTANESSSISLLWLSQIMCRISTTREHVSSHKFHQRGRPVEQPTWPSWRLPVQRLHQAVQAVLWALPGLVVHEWSGPRHVQWPSGASWEPSLRAEHAGLLGHRSAWHRPLRAQSPSLLWPHLHISSMMLTLCLRLSSPCN